jgi:hypothetical protein
MIRQTLAPIVICSAMVALGLSSATAQTSCGPREQLVKVLAERYEENPVGIGLAQPGQVVEIFASSSGSWTMLMTMPDGKACLIAAGENWEMVTKVKGNPV